MSYRPNALCDNAFCPDRKLKDSKQSETPDGVTNGTIQLILLH